jgi:SAM-dependent methyltransferase
MLVEPRSSLLSPCPSLLTRLRSPESGAPLSYDAGRSKLIDPAGREWPVVEGIPRFVESAYLESFGRQWNRYDVVHDDEDRATFEAKTGMRLDELRGLTVLDAGCGGGRYCKVAAEAGASVIGVDHTTAVEKAARLCAHLPKASFVQADLKRLPFEPASFDFVFSIGVMHHDSDTRSVFDAVARFVRPGGRYAVWLYRRNQWWQERINTLLRRRTTQMNLDRLERVCRIGAALGGIPLINKTLNKVINFSAHPDPQNRLCDTFDWYAPAYQHHHTIEELLTWFREAGFEELRVLPPEKSGRLYRWVYERNLLIGSGVNVVGRRV